MLNNVTLELQAISIKVEQAIAKCKWDQNSGALLQNLIARQLKYVI